MPVTRTGKRRRAPARGTDDAAATATAADYSTFEGWLAAFDEDQPAAFYLRGDASLEQLADNFAVVSGVRLPLHSHVLATAAAVLKDLLLCQRGEGGAAPAEVRCAAAVVAASRCMAGRKRRRGRAQAPELPLNRMLAVLPCRNRSICRQRSPTQAPA